MKNYLLVILLITAKWSFGQTFKPDLQDKTLWSTGTRPFKLIDEQGKKGIYIQEAGGNRVMKLNNFEFGNGVIEFDVMGRNVIGQSFVGLAFHMQNDSTYDCVYFRPFNFTNPDTVRRWRAVQYVYLPQYDWSRLREEFPGKYENKVNPVPDPTGWFHCKIVVKGKIVTVYVNNSSTPCLTVTKLNDFNRGPIGIWADNGSDGSFANLEITKE